MRAFLRPVAGVIAGLVLVTASLLLDAATRVAEVGSFAIPTANARPYVASMLGGLFTVAAMVFWVRGMLVQLAAGALPARVLRPYLDDAFLQNTLALILATFSYGSVLLLRLPSGSTSPAPFVAMTGALVLGIASLLAVVVTIVNSVRSTDEGSLLTVLVGQAIEAIRRQYPESGSDSRQEPVATHDAQCVVEAPRSGWVCGVDETRLFETLPRSCHLRIHARTGTFVAQGSTLATYHGCARPDVTRSVQAAFRIARHRDPTADVEYAVGRICDVASAQLGMGSGARTGVHEAFMHLALVLSELATRGEPPSVVCDGDRSIAWMNRLSRAELVDFTLSPLFHTAKLDGSIAVTLLRGLGMAARGVKEGDPLRRCFEEKAQEVLERSPPGNARGGVVDPRHVAREERLLAAHDER